MSHWTIGRRVIAGFAAVILITIALGAFAYSRLVAVRPVVWLAESGAHGVARPTTLSARDTSPRSTSALHSIN